MRQLILREYETTAAVPLTSGERDALARLVPSLTIKPVAAVPGHYDLTPGSLIGGVTINDLAIAIRPKIPIDRLLFLISYTLHRRRWQEFCFPADPERDLVEAVALGFLAQANRALTTGLLHGYQHREDAGQTVRGRIRFGDQIRSHYG